MTGLREQELIATSNALLDARRTGVTLADLPESAQPVDIAEVYFVQDLVAAAYGEIGGWKIGAPNAEATPLFAPMPKAWMAASGATLVGNRYRGL